MKLTLEQAEGFYDVHREGLFWRAAEFMSSGKCMVLALEKDNAVAEWRKTIGATNPSVVEEGTRKEFASSIGENAVHGSDSNENAEKEISYFTGSELRQNK